jgi:two-component system CheB/CheR fusion protein
VERPWASPRTNEATRLSHGGGANSVALREAAFDAGPTAQLVIDPNGVVALANARARQEFGLAAKDVGHALQDLELSYRPMDLRSLVDEAFTKGAPQEMRGVEWRKGNGDLAYLDVAVKPLKTQETFLGNGLFGVVVSFTDVTAGKLLEKELQRANADLAAASEELQSTVEELETTNEELQSTNEELETTNEELQSTNEEQETMNEELQSTNE